MAEEFLTSLNFTTQLLETTTYSWAQNDTVKWYWKKIIPAAMWRMNRSDQISGRKINWKLAVILNDTNKAL